MNLARRGCQSGRVPPHLCHVVIVALGVASGNYLIPVTYILSYLPAFSTFGKRDKQLEREKAQKFAGKNKKESQYTNANPTTSVT